MAQRNFFPVGATALPSCPLTHVKTKKTFPCGTMINGVHHPRWMQLDLTLAVIENSTRTCGSCWREIAVGEIVGFDHMGMKCHCANCIEMPDEARIYRIAYRMARRTRRHPDGMRRESFVCSNSQMDIYLEALRGIIQSDIQVEEVTHAL